MARLTPPTPDPIEALCALDLAGRGIGRLVVPGDMAGAARSLLGAPRVLLITGFVPRPGWAAETDGPSGAVILGRALRGLGAEEGIDFLVDLLDDVAELHRAALLARMNRRATSGAYW